MRIRYTIANGSCCLVVAVRKKCTLVSLTLLLFGISNAWSLLSSPTLLSTQKVDIRPRIRPFQSSSAVCFVSEQQDSKEGVVNHTAKQNCNRTENDNDFNVDDSYDELQESKEAEDDREEGEEEVTRGRIMTLSSLEDLTERILNSNNDGKPIGTWDSEYFEQLEVAMKAWSRQRHVPGSTVPAMRQEQLVRRVVEEKLANNSLAWDVNMKELYDLIILSWSRTHEFGAPQRAEEILDAMQRSYNTGLDGDLKPSLRTWNTVLKAYVHAQSAEAPREVMRVLSKLETLYREGKTDLQPSRDSYYYLLRAQSFVGGPGAAEKVLGLIDRMDKLAVSGVPSIKPDTRCHNVYLRALVETKDHHTVSAREVARKAEAYLRKMAADPDESARPDHWSYNAVLLAWSNSGDIKLASKGEILIEEMELSIEGAPSTPTPTKYEYNTLLSCYSWSTLPDKGERALALFEKMKARSDEDSSVTPDSISYNSVAMCLVKSKFPAPAVESIFHELKERYEATRDPSFKLTQRSHSICVSAMTILCLQWMTCMLTDIVFAAKFEAWAKSDHPEAPKKILEWVHRLQDDFEAGRSDIPPGKWAYNAYLEALSKKRQPSIADEAERILLLLEERSEQFGGSTNLRPDVLTYTNALHCIALSEAENSFQRAYTILLRMEDGNGDVRPNEVCSCSRKVDLCVSTHPLVQQFVIFLVLRSSSIPTMFLLTVWQNPIFQTKPRLLCRC